MNDDALEALKAEGQGIRVALERIGDALEALVGLNRTAGPSPQVITAIEQAVQASAASAAAPKAAPYDGGSPAGGVDARTLEIPADDDVGPWVHLLEPDLAEKMEACGYGRVTDLLAELQNGDALIRFQWNHVTTDDKTALRSALIGLGLDAWAAVTAWSDQPRKVPRLV